MTECCEVLDLFAGPGGWSMAMRDLGITECGIEWDAAACDTAEAAGHRRICDDVRNVSMHMARQHRGLIASPPCQTFSRAGKGDGRYAIEAVLKAVDLVAFGNEPAYALSRIGLDEGDERTGLVLEPLRLIRDGAPEWVALEQVVSVLPVWERYAYHLERWGYSVRVGLLNAEQYGVPQTRRRAILIANRTKRVYLPTPTHSRFWSRDPERLDDGVLPWVSMAEALGWGVREVVGFPRLADPGRDYVVIGGRAYRARDLRPAVQPAQVLTEKARSWIRIDRDALVAEVAPRVNNQSGTEFDLTWPADRPSPVVAGREIITMPGANANRFNGRTKSRNDGIKVEPWEGGVLQSFPSGYPWQGNRTAQFRQVGDAMPPLLARAVINAARGES